MTEYPTTIQTSEKPQSRDWLAVAGFVALGLVAAGQMFASWVDYQASQRYSEAAQALARQIATSAKAYEVAIRHYEPPFENPAIPDGSESPFER